MTKIVYIAHPLSGDLSNNIKKILEICNKVHKEDDNIIPFAPYLVSIQYLNDNIKEDRELGIEANKIHFKRKTFDELWVFGDFISKGVEEEIKLAKEFNIPIIYFNK